MFRPGATTVELLESYDFTARCSCCSILCSPTADGRCATCHERDASVCTCGVHVYSDERVGDSCAECAAEREAA